jgi:hypothetical protein
MVDEDDPRLRHPARAGYPPLELVTHAVNGQTPLALE